MGDLKNWVKKTSMFIKLDDGESYEGVFEGYKIVPSSLDPTKETVQYKLDGKFLQTSSKGLARAIDAVPEGSKVKITREGTAAKTQYKVEILK